MHARVGAGMLRHMSTAAEVPVRSAKGLLWGSFTVALASLAVLVYPIYVIRPFRYQGPRELAVALALMGVRPLLVSVLCACAIVLTVMLWRRTRGIWVRSAAVLCSLLTIAFALLSRMNIYEMMFNPLGQPAFSAAAKSKLKGEEQVIAIRVGQASRAYPTRSMSYHHIVNDTLGGLPVVATY